MCVDLGLDHLQDYTSTTLGLCTISYADGKNSRAINTVSYLAHTYGMNHRCRDFDVRCFAQLKGADHK